MLPYRSGSSSEKKVYAKEGRGTKVETLLYAGDKNDGKTETEEGGASGLSVRLRNGWIETTVT